MLVNNEITYGAFIKRYPVLVGSFMKGQGVYAPVMHPLSGVPGFKSLRIYQKLQTLTLSALYRLENHFYKIGQIDLSLL